MDYVHRYNIFFREPLYIKYNWYSMVGHNHSYWRNSFHNILGIYCNYCLEMVIITPLKYLNRGKHLKASPKRLEANKQAFLASSALLIIRYSLISLKEFLLISWAFYSSSIRKKSTNLSATALWSMRYLPDSILNFSSAILSSLTSGSDAMISLMV